MPGYNNRRGTQYTKCQGTTTEGVHNTLNARVQQQKGYTSNLKLTLVKKIVLADIFLPNNLKGTDSTIV